MGWGRCADRPSIGPPRVYQVIRPAGFRETKVASGGIIAAPPAPHPPWTVRWKRQGGAAEIVASSRSNLRGHFLQQRFQILSMFFFDLEDVGDHFSRGRVIIAEPAHNF